MSRQKKQNSTRLLTPAKLIAPCGINCALCMAHLRERNHCPGCRASNAGKPITRWRCKMKICRKKSGRFCGGCAEFPCERLAHLDRRYRLKYGASPIANLHQIASVGMKLFLAEQKVRWTCPGCSAMLCMHKPACLACGNPWR